MVKYLAIPRTTKQLNFSNEKKYITSWISTLNYEVKLTQNKP